MSIFECELCGNIVADNFREQHAKIHEVTIRLDYAEAQMLLEMFSIIEEEHELVGDMLALYNNLKRQIPHK